MKIAHLGTFDVNNYGDLLFPLVAEWRLPSAEWIHSSPRSGRPDFNDAIAPIDFDQLSKKSFDAIVVGGGNIIHLRCTTLDKYAGMEMVAYPSLSLGAAYLAASHGVPLVINGSSIRKCSLGIIEKVLLRKVLSQTAYAAVRDQFSVETAVVLGGVTCEMIPDTAFDISRMWPVSTLNSVSGYDHIVVHVNNRYGGDARHAALAINEIVSKSGVEVRFLPIGPCHGDVEYMHEVIAKMSVSASAIENLSLRFFAEQIAKSRAYIGSSMHGFITAASYGVPALLVLDEQPMEKFAGLLKTLGAPSEVICSSWSDAAARLDQAWKPGPAGRERIFEALDKHWERMKLALRSHGEKPANSMLDHWKALAKIAQFEVGARRVGPWLARKVMS